MPQNTSNEFPAVWVLPAALRELAECGDTELVDELIAMFLADTATRLEIMQQALTAGDFVAVSAEAHTIKGSAVQVGANRFAGFCQQMESDAKKNPPGDLNGLLGSLLSSFDEVCRTLADRKVQLPL